MESSSIFSTKVYSSAKKSIARTEVSPRSVKCAIDAAESVTLKNISGKSWGGSGGPAWLPSDATIGATEALPQMLGSSSIAPAEIAGAACEVDAQRVLPETGVAPLLCHKMLPNNHLTQDT